MNVIEKICKIADDIHLDMCDRSPKGWLAFDIRGNAEEIESRLFSSLTRMSEDIFQSVTFSDLTSTK